MPASSRRRRRRARAAARKADRQAVARRLREQQRQAEAPEATRHAPIVRRELGGSGGRVDEGFEARLAAEAAKWADGGPPPRPRPADYRDPSVIRREALDAAVARRRQTHPDDPGSYL